MLLLVGGCVGSVPYDEFGSESARLGPATDLAAFTDARDRIAEEMGVEPEDVLLGSLTGSFDSISVQAANARDASVWDTWTIADGALRDPWPMDHGSVNGSFTLDGVPALAELTDLVRVARERAGLGENAMITDVAVSCPYGRAAAPDTTSGNTMSDTGPHAGGMTPSPCDPTVTLTVAEDRRAPVDVEFSSDGEPL
ncbi:hypothetical protein CZ771_00305 [Actinomycetales bacterium JB111]|nr:hypothetical protein CZ771_00305 [Actinomycetales bacterium JB111]